MTLYFFFFFNDTATTEIYTLSLHDALPISAPARPRRRGSPRSGDRCVRTGVARSSRVARSLEVLLEPGEDPLPAVHRGVPAILRAVDGEERVPGIVVRVEHVGLPELLERFLSFGDVLRRGACVLDAEQSQQGAQEILGELDRGDRLTRGQL